MLLLLLVLGVPVITDVQVLTSRLTAPPLPAYSTLRNNSPATTPKMLGKILSWIIYLIFNYQPGLVGLELLQNICEGRECRGNTLTNKRSKYISKWKIELDFYKIQLMKVVSNYGYKQCHDNELFYLRRLILLERMIKKGLQWLNIHILTKSFQFHSPWLFWG